MRNKINVFSLKRPEITSEDVVITDKANPGIEIILTLRTPDWGRISLVNSISESILEEQAKGELNIPHIDGSSIDIDKNLVNLASACYALQEDLENGYSVIELLTLFFTMPTGMSSAVNKVTELMKDYNGLVENPTPAATSPQSELM